MLGNPTGSRPDADVERAVVLETVGERDPLTRDKLAELVGERFEAHRVNAAIDVLLALGALVSEGEHVEPSPVVLRLDELGLLPV